MFALADILIALVVLVSAAFGLSRGLIRELLSVAAWVLAILITIEYTDPVAAYVARHINDEPTQRLVAIFVLFLPALVILSILSGLIARLFLRHHRDSHDQLFGLLFGTVRGIVIVAIAVIVGRATALTHEQWWHESVLIPKVEELIVFSEPYLPEQLNQFMATAEQPLATRRLVLYPSGGGHYEVQGLINGQPVQFLLDTGASVVMIPQLVADRVGLERGNPLTVLTAIGETTAYEVTLESIRIGNIEVHNVRGAINPQSTDEQVLLGTSFLRRLDFQQRGNSLILEQTRYIDPSP